MPKDLTTVEPEFPKKSKTGPVKNTVLVGASPYTKLDTTLDEVAITPRRASCILRSLLKTETAIAVPEITNNILFNLGIFHFIFIFYYNFTLFPL